MISIASFLRTNFPTLLAEDSIAEKVLKACKEGNIDGLSSLVPADFVHFIREMVSGELPLHTAVKNGHMEMASYLIKLGAQPELKDPEGLTAYDYAALLPNHEQALPQLIGDMLGQEVHATINPKIAQEAQKLQKTIQSYCKEIPPNKCFEKIRALHKLFSVPKIDEKQIRILAQEPLDEAGNTLVHFLAAQGDNKRLKALLSKGVDPNLANAAGQTPLHFAAAMDSSCLKVLLLKKGDVGREDIACVSPLALIGAKAQDKDPLKLPLIESLLVVAALVGWGWTRDLYATHSRVFLLFPTEMAFLVQKHGWLHTLGPVFFIQALSQQGIKGSEWLRIGHGYWRAASIAQPAFRAIQSAWSSRHLNRYKSLRNIGLHAVNLAHASVSMLIVTMFVRDRLEDYFSIKLRLM